MKKLLPIAVLLLLSVGLCLLPSAPTLATPEGKTTVATVVSTDNSALERHGLLEFGSQQLTVQLKDGHVCRATNELRAQMELDKKFAPGDRALVVLGAEPLTARDHWRLGWIVALFFAFAALLTIFGGWTGLKALLSFVFSCLAVWKLLVPLCLKGWNAAWVSFLVVSVLTAVIMYLVAGATKKGVVAFLGAMLGVAVSLGLADFFVSVMHVNGATMPFVQTLLYSGFESLKISDVFIGAVVLGSSGAVMDLAMDIAAGLSEVVHHHPEVTRLELFQSGIRMGRAVVGTMTTTLLLAYSGGYLTLLMVFAAQGTPPVDFINSTLVSAEVVKTLVGSFGLVLVAPFTALVGSVILRKG